MTLLTIMGVAVLMLGIGWLIGVREANRAAWEKGYRHGWDDCDKWHRARAGG